MKMKALSSVKCTNSVGTFYLWDKEIRLYPTDEIAKSWDPESSKASKIDCSKFTQGPNLRHRDGSTVRCAKDSPSSFRIWKNEIRLYSTLEIRKSWDAHWQDTVSIDCTGLKIKNQMPNREGSSISCKDMTGAFRLSGDEFRWYPNPSIADSWDPTWRDRPTIDCSNLKRGPSMNFQLGSSVKCMGRIGVFRLWTNEIRMYPTIKIAESWDKRWESATELNCNERKIGHKMPHKEGSSVKCSDISTNFIYRLMDDELRPYPNREIATSWDPTWETAHVKMKCKGLVIGPAMRQKS